MRFSALRLAPVGLLVLYGCSKADTTTGPADPVVTSISLSVTNLSLTSFGETGQVVATALDQGGATMGGASITWTSSNGSVASVGGGLVTAVGNGSAQVTAEAGTVTAGVAVTVDQAEDSIDVSASNVTLDRVGDTTRVSTEVFDEGGSPIVGAGVSWSVSDPAVVSVSADGLVTALGVGNAVVTLTSGSASVQILVSVTAAAPTGVILTSFRDGDWEIYSMDADGGNPVNLTNAPGTSELFGTPAPGGATIAFTSDRDGDREIYAMDADGSNLVNLTNDPRDDFYPAWSWDGSKIAFSRSDTIWVMDADGSNQTSLGVQGYYPSWSPDGARIALITGSIGSGVLQLMDADGSNLTNVSPGSGWGDVAPAWSTDGSRVAFSTRFSSGGHDVYLVDVDGANLDNLTSTAGFGESFPSWSADGARILYATNITGDSEIWLMDADGSNPTQVTFVPGLDSYPHWVR